MKDRFGREIVRYVRIPIYEVTAAAIERLRKHGDLAGCSRDTRYLEHLLSEAVFAAVEFAEGSWGDAPANICFNVATTSFGMAGQKAPPGYCYIAEPRRIKFMREHEEIQTLLAAAAEDDKSNAPMNGQP